MADEMYPSGDDPGMSEKPEAMDHSDQEGETALIPTSLLGGKEFKVGDEVVLKIVHMYDDEVEVAYSEGKADKKAEPDNDESPFSDSKMKAMGVMK